MRDKKSTRFQRGRVLVLLALLATLLLAIHALAGDVSNAAAPPQTRVVPEEQPQVQNLISLGEDPAVQAKRSATAIEQVLASAKAAVPAKAAVDDSYFSDTVFIGDSRTEGLSLYAGISGARYLYAVGATVSSICNDATEKTAQGKVPIMDALAQQHFSKVYIMLGINELGWVYSQTFYDQYSTVIDRIRQINPDATVVLQSILPIGVDEESKGGYISNERIAQYNTLVQQLAQEKSCTYLDVASAFTGPDGCLPPEMDGDGIHLSVKGCKAWMQFLRENPV